MKVAKKRSWDITDKVLENLAIILFALAGLIMVGGLFFFGLRSG